MVIPVLMYACLNLLTDPFLRSKLSISLHQDGDIRLLFGSINFLPSSRNTAKTFYAASIFFEILNQFGELQPDVSLCSR